MFLTPPIITSVSWFFKGYGYWPSEDHDQLQNIRRSNQSQGITINISD